MVYFLYPALAGQARQTFNRWRFLIIIAADTKYPVFSPARLQLWKLSIELLMSQYLISPAGAFHRYFIKEFICF